MMALNTAAPGVRLGDGASQRLADLRQAWGRYKLYRATLKELRALSPRDLEDIGILPGDIHAIARQAAGWA
jgi:uncharacterized protein YjiS (DUF1127 family)